MRRQLNSSTTPKQRPRLPTQNFMTHHFKYFLTTSHHLSPPKNYIYIYIHTFILSTQSTFAKAEANVRSEELLHEDTQPNDSHQERPSRPQLPLASLACTNIGYKPDFLFNMSTKTLSCSDVI